MREIKFRIWYKPENGDGEMISWELIPYTEESLLQYFTEQGFYPLQYTGLKDKNGKEIYEGDVVKSQDGDFKETVYTVVWSDTTNPGLYLKHGYSYRIIFPLSFKMEIIGNIYENPELLEV